jgi:hypothetical protein
LLSAVIVMAANVVLTLLTYRYVKLTGGMLDHMRRAQAASVDIDITFRDQDAYLNVINKGNTAATHIEFEALNGFDWAQHSSIPELREHGISYLPAGRTMRFWLGFPNWDVVKKEHLRVKIGLAYDAEGSRQRRDFVIDMTQYLGTSGQTAPEERIVAAIDRLKDALPGRDPFVRLGLFRSAKKACVMCAESIPAAAKICSRCHSPQDLPTPEDKAEGPTASNTSEPIQLPEPEQQPPIEEHTVQLSTTSVITRADGAVESAVLDKDIKPSAEAASADGGGA